MFHNGGGLLLSRYRVILILILTIIMAINVGCNSKSNDNKIAYISANVNSKYETTFKELSLGFLLDFNLKLPKADKSWVTIWVEGYSGGKPVEPFHLIELSYGISPKEVEEGSIGFGMIDSYNEEKFNEEKLLFLYSPYVKARPHNIDDNFFIDFGASTWDYAIGNEKITLESGQELILGVYRQVEKSLRTYDYQNLDSINQMIDEDITVLLLKIKVEEKNEPIEVKVE